MTTTLVRKNTARDFIKDGSGLRVESAATERFIEVLTQLADQLVQMAAAEATDAQRRTVQVEDIQVGFDRLLIEQGASLLSPSGLHQAIDGIDNDGLTELINLLRVDLEGRGR
jgi:histone H3/H4